PSTDPINIPIIGAAKKTIATAIQLSGKYMNKFPIITATAEVMAATETSISLVIIISVIPIAKTAITTFPSTTSIKFSTVKNTGLKKESTTLNNTTITKILNSFCFTKYLIIELLVVLFQSFLKLQYS